MKIKLTPERQDSVRAVLSECAGLSRHGKIRALTRSDRFSPRLSWREASSLLAQMPRKRKRAAFNRYQHDAARYAAMMERADLQ